MLLPTHGGHLLRTVFSFYFVNPKDQARVIRLCSRHLYLLSYLVRSQIKNLEHRCLPASFSRKDPKR